MRQQQQEQVLQEQVLPVLQEAVYGCLLRAVKLVALDLLLLLNHLRACLSASLHSSAAPRLAASCQVTARCLVVERLAAAAAYNCKATGKLASLRRLESHAGDFCEVWLGVADGGEPLNMMLPTFPLVSVAVAVCRAVEGPRCVRSDCCPPLASSGGRRIFQSSPEQRRHH